MANVTCQVSGNTVYVRDERGFLIEMFSYPDTPTAQSFGNGVTITCGTMCYTYTLDDRGKLVQSGVYGI